MPSTTNYEPGDIVLVRFPFTDLSSGKQRPAVVISPLNYGRRYGDFVLMPLTSQLQVEAELSLTASNSAGLPKPTWIKPVIGTLSSNLLLRVIGRLEPIDEQVVRAAIALVLDARW